jgi:hypothetical protein
MAISGHRPPHFVQRLRATKSETVVSSQKRVQSSSRSAGRYGGSRG